MRPRPPRSRGRGPGRDLSSRGQGLRIPAPAHSILRSAPLRYQGVDPSADWYICAAMVTGAIEAPKKLEDLHVRRDLVASLLLRTLAFADQLSGASIETRLGLPFESLQPLIEEFQKSQLMDTLGFS